MESGFASLLDISSSRMGRSARTEEGFGVTDRRDATEVDEMTKGDYCAFVEAECQRALGLSTAEFLRRWTNGHYRLVDDMKVVRVAALLPDAR